MKIIIALFASLTFAFAVNAQSEFSVVDLQNCIALDRDEPVFITNDGDLQASIRQDASRDRCFEVIRDLNIDFGRQVLAGTRLYTGYCRTPAGLTTAIERDEHGNIAIVVSYLRTEMSCKALSFRDHWVIAPIAANRSLPRFAIRPVEPPAN